MIDKSREDQIERWADYIKNNPDWKFIHTEFINAQFEKAYRFINELAKTKEGQLKIVEIYNIKNIKGYPDLLKDLQ